jgi:hypothetical protein
MNKNEHCGIKSTTSQEASRRREKGPSRPAERPASPDLPRPASPDSKTLSTEAERLLGALAQPGAEALVDRTEEATVIVRRLAGAVSVGAGRFASSAAEALVRNDLAAWAGESRGPSVLRLTEAGLSRHKRRSARDVEEGFRDQHGSLSTATLRAEGGSVQVRVEAEESPLDWLHRRRDRDGQPFIDAACYEAGQRLRADITQAGLLPSVTARWEAPRGGPSAPAEATDRMIAARQRLRHAFDAVGGEFSDLLTDLCGFLKGLEQIERERRWPPRSAKVVVRLALRRLAEHYGLESLARGPSASRGVRVWQAVVIEGGRA